MPLESMEAQLRSLYEDRELLERELGVSSPTVLIAMIRSMEAQLIDLYREKEEACSSETSPSGSSSGSR
jgi:hypothetical protein